MKLWAALKAWAMRGVVRRRQIREDEAKVQRSIVRLQELIGKRSPSRPDHDAPRAIRGHG